MRTRRYFAFNCYRRATVLLLALVSVSFLSIVQAQSPTVSATNDLRFQPGTLEVPAGTTVTWRNTSDVAHTVTADPSKASDPSHVQLPQGAQPFDSGLIQPGQSFSHTFSTPGEYKYFCIPHESAGMIATVTVTE